MQLPTHLGDGAYLDHDGYQFWLAVNDHRNRVVALDPGAYRQFIEASTTVAAQRMFGHELMATMLETIARKLRDAAPAPQADPDDDFDVLEDD